MTKYKMAAVCWKNCMYRHKKGKPKLEKYTNIFASYNQGLLHRIIIKKKLNTKCLQQSTEFIPLYEQFPTFF